MNIIRELVKRNIKVQYRNSALGAIWTVLNPLLNMLVMFVVFGAIFNYSETDKTYALYLLCGNVIFGMMRTATTQSLTTLVANRGLLTKNRISYSVFPLSLNLTAVVNFLFSCIALLAVMVVVQLIDVANPALVGPVFSWNILYVLAMLPAFFLFNYGISLLLSALYVFFRDVQHLYNVFLTMWTYFTPIFYKTDRFENKTWGPVVVWVLENLNPMYYFVDYFRAAIYDVSANGATMPSVWPLYLIGLLFFAIGGTVFLITKRKFIFYI